MSEQYDVGQIMDYLRNQKEMDPDKHDGCYELMRATTEEYGHLPDLSAVDYKDVNVFYHVTIGTWSQSIESKKKSITESHLPEENQKRLIQKWDDVWKKASEHEYENTSVAEPGKPSIGLFGTGFFSFGDKTSPERFRAFIQLCIDLLPMTDDDAIYERASKVLSTSIYQMQAASASMILHCLKPETFPVLNSNLGGGNIFMKLGVQLDNPEKLATYIDNCRKIKAFRDKNFTAKNYRVYDLAAQKYQNMPSEDLTGWRPPLNEYAPCFTTNEWVDLLNDKDLFKDEWLAALAMFYLEKDGASCKKIGQTYNIDSQAVNGRMTQIGFHLHDKTDCPLYNGKYWPIMFIGRKTKPGEVGTFLWKLRPELYEACTKVNILQYLPPIQPDPEPGPGPEPVVFSKNLILYGPPGTGKTYNAVNYAVAICESRDLEEVKADDYEDVLYRFNSLKAEGRIAFTTFHQSYGYEEFIEGIKPDLDNETGSIGYTIADGIFKEFCSRAGAVSIQTEAAPKMKEQPRIWGMILGGSENKDIEKQCFANNEIRLNWAEVDDADIEGDYETDEKSSWNAKHMVYDFKYSMEPGDIIVIEKTQKSIDAIGLITGDYVFDEAESSYQRSRSVEWLVKDIDCDIMPFLLPKGRKHLARYSLFAFDYIGMDVISQILSEHNGTSPVKVEHETKPYVFIIDEINRGNISKIFGELITLIEETKRAGASEAMEAKLPYSGEDFSIPQNVYILGTMNTADRSIALMDTALRRRFDFVEMMPDTEILQGVAVRDEVSDTSVEIDKMLEAINRRIEVLYDREHMIGHAYFMKLREDPTMENLRDVFLNRIIPLLQEYFYDDYGKIRLILGDNDKSLPDGEKFIVEEEISYGKVFRGKAEDDEPDGRRVYRINEDAFRNIASYRKIYD